MTVVDRTRLFLDRLSVDRGMSINSAAVHWDGFREAPVAELGGERWTDAPRPGAAANGLYKIEDDKRGSFHHIPVPMREASPS